MNRNVGALLKADGADGEVSPVKPSSKSAFEYRCRKVGGICASLSKGIDEYTPKKTVSSIEDYFRAGENNRIIYSVITNQVYAMTLEQQGDFDHNLERLLDYVMEPSSDVNPDIQDAVIRLWDHVHLAIRQAGNVKEEIESSVESTRDSLHEKLHEELHQEFDGMAKDYTTILGIFSSIVISFVAGLVFSSSVLENMHQVSIFRLSFVIIMLGFVIVNVINLLVRYIFSLNKPDPIRFPICKVNIIFAALLFIVMLGWLLKVNYLPNFLDQFFPW